MQTFVDAPIARQRHAAQRDLHQQIAGQRMSRLFRTQQPLRRGLRRGRTGDAVQPHPRVFHLRLDMPRLRCAQMPVLRIVHALRVGQRERQREGVFGRTGFGSGLQFGERHGRIHSCDSTGSQEMTAALIRCQVPVSGSVDSMDGGFAARSSQRGLPFLSRCIQ